MPFVGVFIGWERGRTALPHQPSSEHGDEQLPIHLHGYCSVPIASAARFSVRRSGKADLRAKFGFAIPNFCSAKAKSAPPSPRERRRRKNRLTVLNIGLSVPEFCSTNRKSLPRRRKSRRARENRPAEEKSTTGKRKSASRTGDRPPRTEFPLSEDPVRWSGEEWRFTSDLSQDFPSHC